MGETGLARVGVVRYRIGGLARGRRLGMTKLADCVGRTRVVTVMWFVVMRVVAAGLEWLFAERRSVMLRLALAVAVFDVSDVVAMMFGDLVDTVSRCEPI